MATMKDIAKLASVSYGTVSNVLNKRGNISSEKIELVEKAAKQLGYTINQNASSLRGRLTESMALIIPNITTNKYLDFYNALKFITNKLNINFDLYLSNYNPVLEQKHADKALFSRCKNIIVISSLENPAEFYSQAYFNNTKIIIADKKINANKKNIYNVFFDTEKASDDLQKYVKQKNYKNILLFSERSVFCDFYDINKLLKKANHIHYISCDTSFDFSKSLDICNSMESYDLIIASSIEKANSLQEATEVLANKIDCDIVIISSKDIELTNRYKIYHRDYGKLAKKTIDIINDHENTVNNEFKIANDGFNTMPDIRKLNETLNLLMLDSPTTNVIIKIKPYLEKTTGLKLNIVKYRFDDFTTIFNSPNGLNMYDLIRMDMVALKSLGKDVFLPLEESNKDFSCILNNFIQNIGEYTTIDDKKYCLPLDPSCQLLLYRKDIFEDAKIKRIFYETYKKELTVPETFDEYVIIEEFLTNNIPNVPKGGNTCTRSSLTCASEFLTRALSYNPGLFTENKVNIKSPKTVKAFENYKKSNLICGGENYSFWTDVIKDFSAGKIAMTICYSNHFKNVVNSKYSSIIGNVGFANVPGGKPLVGGGIIGISKASKKIDACYNLLKLIYSDDVSKLITMLGGSTPNKKVYSNYNILSFFPWLEKIPEIISNNKRHLLNHKNISTLDLEYIIGNYIRNALHGAIDIDSALEMIENSINEKS